MVACSGDSTKGAKVVLASVAETVKAVGGEVFRYNHTPKGHSDVGQVEIVRLSEPRSLQIIRICEEVKTVNAMMPAPVRALGHCGMVEAVAIQARDAALEELRIPFQISADWIALCG